MTKYVSPFKVVKEASQRRIVEVKLPMLVERDVGIPVIVGQIERGLNPVRVDPIVNEHLVNLMS